MAQIYSYNPGLNLRQVIPSGILNSSEFFVDFLKTYYEWLHTTEIRYKITSGTFQKGEAIIGQTSKNVATINYLKSADVLVVFVTGKFPFERNENIVGQTSGAVAKLLEVKDNVLRKSNEILNNRDVDKSVDIFSEYLKDELYNAIPSNYTGDKRLLAKRIRDYYQSKGHEQSYKFLMKLLYDQDAEISYPGEEVLNVSDGNFVKEYVIRARIIGDDSDNTIFNFLFKTIKGRTSESIANVIDIKKIFVGTEYLAEFKLSLVSGQFIAEEEIYDIGDTNPTPLSTTIYGIISECDVVYGGSGYSVGDVFQVTGDGQDAYLRVSETQESGIDAIKLISTGYGYRQGTIVSANNTGTEGSNLSIIVSEISNSYSITIGANNYVVGDIARVNVLNKGQDYADIPTLVLRDTLIYNQGMISEKNVSIVSGGNYYKPGETVQFNSGGYTTQANAEIASVSESGPYDYNIYLEDGDGTYNTLLLESDDFAKYNTTNTSIVDWTANGAITRIKMTNRGSGYTEANVASVVITFPNTVSGTSANLQVLGIMGGGANVVVDVANNSGGIGSIRRVEVINFGVDYSNANVSTVTIGNEDAVLTPIIRGSAETFGRLVGDNGKLDYKRLQDSYYYQKYSYLIRSGIEITKYKNVLKKLIHPAGLEVFGEIAIRNNLNLKMVSEDPAQVDNILKMIIIILSQANETLDISKVLDWSPEDYPMYADLTISFAESNSLTIEDYQYIYFSTPYGVEPIYREIEKQIKIDGTVSVNTSTRIVSGTNTVFLEFFSANDEFVVVDRVGSTGSNRFIIDTVSSNTQMTIKIPHTVNILNAEAYRLSL